MQTDFQLIEDLKLNSLLPNEEHSKVQSLEEDDEYVKLRDEIRR